MITELYLSQSLYLRKLHLNLGTECLMTKTKSRSGIMFRNSIPMKRINSARFILVEFLNLDFNKISVSLHCCHACNEPTCINPLHLYFGSATENAMDRIPENRNKPTSNGGREKYHYIAISPTGMKLKCVGLRCLKEDFGLDASQIKFYGKPLVRVKGQKAPKALGWTFFLEEKVFDDEKSHYIVID